MPNGKMDAVVHRKKMFFNKAMNFLSQKKISILIPVFNEEKTIELILNKVLKETEGWDKEVIVVNDGSRDGTSQRLEKFSDKIILLNNDKNYGKGFSLGKGFKIASGDIVIIQDADLEYDPSDYGKLLAPILENKTEIVFGSRNIAEGNFSPSKLYLFGGKFLTGFFNFIFKTKFTDINTGYKVFKKEVLGGIEFKENRFAFCEEFTAKAVRKGFSIVEVPIKYSGRTISQGKKLRWQDGLRGFWVIIKNYLTA
jgi:glycosyltransferase involved in cell wall biosynthesis